MATADSPPATEPNPDGYLWISHGVLPLLRELGVSDDSVNTLMVESPRRFFEGTGQ